MSFVLRAAARAMRAAADMPRVRKSRHRHWFYTLGAAIVVAGPAGAADGPTGSSLAAPARVMAYGPTESSLAAPARVMADGPTGSSLAAPARVMADGPTESSLAAPAVGAANSPLETLLAEARDHNPEIAAAQAQSEAAEQRLAPAGALEDPMVELGVINMPLPVSFRREDMTMKMLGLSQKLPFPGKRDLRRSVARADAVGVAYAVSETVNRVMRDVRVAYEDLRSIQTSRRLLTETLVTVRQLESMAEGRYKVGEADQGEVLQAQIEVVRLQQELLRFDQEEAMRHSELVRLLGRHEDTAPIVPTPGVLLDLPASPKALEMTAQDQRPQLKALGALLDKSDQALALARREYFPDFELRLGYGQRDRMLDGTARDDMISFTVAVNLPLWRKSRLAPRVAEARAMQREAGQMIESQRLEITAGIAQQLAIEQQQRASAVLYRSTLEPQTHAAFESALVAYRVGRSGFKTLLDARMAMYQTALGESEAIARHNKAVAEIDLLTGRAFEQGSSERAQRSSELAQGSSERAP